MSTQKLIPAKGWDTSEDFQGHPGRMGFLESHRVGTGCLTVPRFCGQGRRLVGT